MSVFYDFGQGTGGANLENWLAPNYDPSVEWKKGQYCVYLGVLKQCLTPTTGVFDESKWKDDFLINKSSGGSGSDSFEFIAKEYDPAETHDKGEIALYGDETYECLEDGTTGAWDASKWKRTYLADVSQNLGGKDCFEFALYSSGNTGACYGYKKGKMYFYTPTTYKWLNSLPNDFDSFTVTSTKIDAYRENLTAIAKLRGRFVVQSTGRGTSAEQYITYNPTIIEVDVGDTIISEVAGFMIAYLGE